MKIALLGIDAMDRELVSRFIDELPNIKKIIEETPNFNITSVFPPDTPTAWASIYTGLDPAKHGILYFIDPLEKVGIVSKDIDNSSIKGRTFWDIAGENDKKVCILLPELGYPVWPVNGVFIGRTHQKPGQDFPVQAYPNSIKGDVDSVNTFRTVPNKKYLEEDIKRYKDLIEEEKKLGLKMFKTRWDLFFFYSQALDWAGHNLWNYFDKTDPSYPGNTPYEDTIMDFYKLYDELIGDFISNMDSDTVIIIFSDHGQGKRPAKLVNINEILKRNAYLKSKIGKNPANPYFIFEQIKKGMISIINKYGIGPASMKIIHFIPKSKRIFTSPVSIDFNKTIACFSDHSGIKSYPYGGIIINKEVLSNGEYNRVVTDIIRIFKEIKDPETNEDIFRWISRREELYSGRYLSKYPDILFHLNGGYGGGWSAEGSIFGKCRTHNIQPGSHRMYMPVLFAYGNKDMEVLKNDLKMMDIAPTVISLLGLEGDFGFDGETFIKMR